MAAKKWLHCVEQKQKEFILKALVDPGFRMQVLRGYACIAEHDADDDEKQDSDASSSSAQDLESQIEAIADELLFACAGPRGRA